MSRWFEHPCTGKTLEGDQVLNVLSYLNEAKESFKKVYGDPYSKESPLEAILKMWPDKSSVKKEWLRRVLDNGPMNDKIQSMGSVICEFPMHSLYYLDSLISLVNLNKKRMAIISSDLLSKIFAKFLLPKGRPLISINERPLSTLINMKSKNVNAISPREKVLTFWYFEEQLKARYTRFVNALEELIKNEPDKVNKIKIIKLCNELSKNKESQSCIIDILVNKLGDLNSKVTGCAFSKLNEIATKDHLLMPKIVRSIRKFVFRPNLSKKAQYYAIQLLAHCQINKKFLQAAPIEEGDDSGIVTDNIAVEMIQIYIGIFKRLIDGSKTKCEKLYTALMSGLSRALPYTKGVDVQKYTNSVFELVHSSNLNLSIHGLKVLYSIVTSNRDSAQEAEGEVDNFDRYMRLMYSTILNPAIFFNSQKISLVNIFFKSVASDIDTVRVKAMVKRLLQLCLHHPEPGFICVCLLFLSRLTNSKHKSIFDRKIKSVVLPNNMKMPVINVGDSVGCGITIDDNDDSGDEIMPDILSDNEEIIENNNNELEIAKDLQTTSWVHYKNQNENHGAMMHYDPFSRNPKFANSDKEILNELDMLKNHYHPSVRIFAEKLLNKERIIYKSDPSEDMSLIKFLDRFAYKNPKKLEDKRKRLPGMIRIEKDEIRQIAVNTKEFADLNEQKVPEDQIFFHKFFNHSKKNKKPKVTEEIDSEFEDSDTEFDAHIMKSNMIDDDLNLSGSEMEDVDDDLVFSDDSEEIDFNSDEQELELNNEDMESDNDGDNMSVNDDDDDDLEEDDDDDDVEMDEEMCEDDSEEEEEETIHSSKRKHLGKEMSNITTGALTLGKSFDNIKEKASNRIKSDRKRRKSSKNKGPDRKINFKSKLAKRKFK